MPRADFSPSTRTVIGARAGYRCSYPDCNRLTVGPGKAADTYEDTGIAAHIYAASSGGPRGQGGLGSLALSEASNGIWMCGHHGDLIDKKKGVRFPVNTLLGWKALQEYRISYEHSGKKAAYGFVRSLTVNVSSLFQAGAAVELAKTTFLIGNNGSGKTALCQWLAALDAPSHLGRWMQRQPLDYEIRFDAPIEHRLQVQARGGALSLTLDGLPVSVNHARATVVYIPERGNVKIRCDRKRLSMLLGMDEIELGTLARMVSTGWAKSLSFEAYVPDEDEEMDEGDDDRQCLILTLPDGSKRTYSALSGGEKGMILLDLAIAKAQSAAQFAPTLLLVELKSIGIDWGNFLPYLNYFSSNDCTFQTIVTSWELPESIEKLGWQIYKLTLDSSTGSHRIDPAPAEPG